MSIRDTIQSWRWRIVRVGHNQASFCDRYNISRGAMSEYLAEKKTPSIKRFERIEKIIKDLEEVADVTG